MQGSIALIIQKMAEKTPEQIAVIADERGREYPLSMLFRWPVKRAINC